MWWNSAITSKTQQSQIRIKEANYFILERSYFTGRSVKNHEIDLAKPCLETRKNTLEQPTFLQKVTDESVMRMPHKRVRQKITCSLQPGITTANDRESQSKHSNRPFSPHVSDNNQAPNYMNSLTFPSTPTSFNHSPTQRANLQRAINLPFHIFGLWGKPRAPGGNSQWHPAPEDRVEWGSGRTVPSVRDSTPRHVAH